jgi:arginase family enzyme
LNAVYLNLDDAWEKGILGLPQRDARNWGPRLRYIARKMDVEAFHREVEKDLAPFILYGSGDFHHLAGVLLRRIGPGPVTLVSFDNHPDWDVRPPCWACGGWAARTLATGHVERVSVWGCGNFELRFPSRLFANRAALNRGTLQVHAWAERQPPAVQKRFDCMTRENWRARFEQFAKGLAGCDVYVTVDMDCLRAEEAVTNWENGLFTAENVAWAIGALRASAKLVGGDVCGAYSPQAYARPFQRLAGKWDHPKIAEPDDAEARRINRKSLETIWPALTDPSPGGA